MARFRWSPDRDETTIRKRGDIRLAKTINLYRERTWRGGAATKRRNWNRKFGKSGKTKMDFLPDLSDLPVQLPEMIVASSRQFDERAVALPREKPVTLHTFWGRQTRYSQKLFLALRRDAANGSR